MPDIVLKHQTVNKYSAGFRIKNMGRKPAKEAVFEMKITESNKALHSHEVWQKMLLNTFQKTSEAIILLNYKGIVCKVNPAAGDLFGYELNEFEKLSLHSLLISLDDSGLKVSIPDLLHKAVNNIQGIRKDKHIFPVNLRMNNFSASNSVYALLFVSTPDNSLIKDKAVHRRNAEIVKLKELNNRLKNQSERLLRDRTQVLQETVDSLVETEQKLRLALNKEIEANEKCSKFAFLISHEYRNPLTAILTSINLIERYGNRDNNLGKAQCQHINKVREYVQQLVTVTDELLCLNTALNSTHKISTNEVIVDELLREVAQTWSQAGINHSKIPIRLNSSGKIIVVTNGDLLKQAIVNLVSNAIKYSEGKGEVIIECDEDEDGCIISVKDQGRGIPKEELNKLSNGFYRATNSKGISGHGLGLFIVRQFLEHLNGKLELVSELDLGTCATIRLPKKYEEKSIAD